MIVPNAQANLARIPDGLTDEEVLLCPDFSQRPNVAFASATP